MSEEELLSQWYEQYSTQLFKYIFKMTGNGYQAEDLLQEAYIRVFHALSKKGGIKYPKTYLFRIAHNLVIDHIRKQAPVSFLKSLFSLKDS